MATPSCPGTIGTEPVTGAATCTEAWVAVEPFDIAQLDPEVAASAFAAGFVIIGIAFVTGWALRAVLKAINS